MSRGFWRRQITTRKFEYLYSTTGVFLGLVIWGVSLLVDSFVRDTHGLDGGLSATFLSTSLHGLNLLAPIVLGRIFWSFGAMRTGLETRLWMARETERISRDRALRDTVTDLFNRPYLLDRLEEGLATGEWQRRGALLFMLDLDGFKGINDTHGHPAGDKVLVSIGRRIGEVASAQDIAVRLGGDEFVLVHFPQEKGDGVAERFAARLIEAITKDVVVNETRIRIRTSVGIARAGMDGATCSDLLKAADLALYSAKQERNGTYRIYEPAMRAEIEELLRTEQDLRDGIGRGEFFLDYQPIIGTSSGAIRSFEALLRWRHPERGIVPPLDFVPLAESTGLIIALGRWVLTEACRTAATWPKPIGVSVNLSPRQFDDPGLVDYVSATLTDSGLAPGRLDLEVTESLLLAATQRTRTVMHALKGLGVRITMDDFGTGYSGFSSLQNFPFDRLKIDRSFTRDLGVDAVDEEIVRAIVRLSGAMRMETVLEGVETAEQLAFAKGEGLTEVQGYYYSRPLSQRDAATLLQGRAETRPAAVA